ncbi:hypothetical protein U1Q18_031098, partial [Sarracenia purpurea var. burkii]
AGVQRRLNSEQRANPCREQRASDQSQPSRKGSKSMSRTESKRAEHSIHVAIKANLDPVTNRQTPVVGGS